MTVQIRAGLFALSALAGCIVVAGGGCGGSGAVSDGNTGGATGADLATTGTTGDDVGGQSAPTETDAGVAPAPGQDVASQAQADAAAPVPDAGASTAEPGITAEAWQALVRRGRQRFNATCDTCHPGGDEDIGPRIIGKNFSVDRMRQQIRNGSGRMRPIPVRRLADEDLDALFAYLSTLRAVRGVERPQ